MAPAKEKQLEKCFSQSNMRYQLQAQNIMTLCKDLVSCCYKKVVQRSKNVEGHVY